MPKVIVLSDHVASQIAAGEVVERPSSVVKELVENSIDSGATRIDIDISKDCRDIRVADNGCGMSPDDATLALQRHATSKLLSADDLMRLSTLGFRGEALPSIASISKFSCLTRTKDASTGTRVEANDGQTRTTETGCAPGTVMEVRELFYNVPARLKFLKRSSTEMGHIQEIVQSLAISYPSIAFSLSCDSKSKLKTSGSGDPELVLSESKLFTGKESLIELLGDDTISGVKLSGFLARPTHFRGDRKGILTIVNKRPVRCPLSFKALDYAYSDLIPRGKYPLALVSIELEPASVDVNIHPTKKEIKYANSHDVYMALHKAVSEALREPRKELFASSLSSETTSGVEGIAYDSYNTSPATNTAPDRSLHRPSGLEYARIYERGDDTGGSRTAAGVASATTDIPDQLSFGNQLSYQPYSEKSIASLSVSEEPTLSYLSGFETDNSTSLPAGWRLAGYLHNMYFIIETPDGIELIEQHIAHERYLYERILASQETRGRTTSGSQRLCISAPLGLTPTQIELLRENQEALRQLGFEFEFEEGNVQCTQVPLEMAHQKYSSVVQKMIDDIEDVDAANVPLEATKSIACQAAIKNGMTLSYTDIVKLIAGWLETPRNDTCPHGRPIRLKLSKQRLFDMFHPA